MKIESDTVTYKFGSLQSVHAFDFTFDDGSGPLRGAISLKFDDGIIYHEWLSETDEISRDSKLIEEYDKVYDISHEKQWEATIGKSILWMHVLINQQGYEDAIQYTFANTVSDDATILQLVAESGINIYEVKK